MNEAYGSDESLEGLVQQLASFIRRNRLAGLAVFALEFLKPLGFVAGQLLWIADPVLRSVTGHSSRRYAHFLEDHGGIERLLASLENEPLEPPNLKRRERPWKP